MDDETFRKDVLNRLDQIIELLSSALPEACIEEPEGEVDAEAPGAATGGAFGEPDAAGVRPFLIGDEMQEDYRFAMQRWEQERSGK